MKTRLSIGSSTAARAVNGNVETAPSDKPQIVSNPNIGLKKLRGVNKVPGLKLPFERDESADSSGKLGGALTPTPPPSEKMKQAVRDIERGVQDTDRGAVVGSTYTQMKR